LPKPSLDSGREVARAQGERARREPGVASASHEAIQPGTRRRFTPAEKVRLVKAAEAAIASGERGALEALLRKEGIYSSHLSTWRRQLAANGESGLAARKPGRKPRLDAAARALLAVTKENEALKHKLRVATAIIDLQKKAHEVLGLTLPELPEDLS
jgi:transposase-like protein